MTDNNRGTRGGRGGRMPLRASGRGVRGIGRGGRVTPTIDLPSSDQPMTDAETTPLPSPSPSAASPSSSTPAPSPSTAGPSSSSPALSPPSVGPSSSRSTTERIVIRPGPGNLEMYPSTKKFTWEPQHEWEIKKAFDHRGSCLINASMNHIRNGKSKGNWIAAHIKAQLEKYFVNNLDFQKKSAIDRQNWAVDAGVLAYTGGRIPAGEYYDRMTQEMGRPPIAIEILAKTKKLKSGEWVTSMIHIMRP